MAVIFLPPKLVASVYGMTFETLSGVHHQQSPLIVTRPMAGSALGTCLYCRSKGWL